MAGDEAWLLFMGQSNLILDARRRKKGEGTARCAASIRVQRRERMLAELRITPNFAPPDGGTALRTVRTGGC